MGLGVLGLSACSSIENPPPNPIPSTRSYVAQLAGTWNTNFTLDTAFTDRIQLSEIQTTEKDPNDFYIWGANKAGYLALGWYDPKTSEYVITVNTKELTQFYEFSSIAADGRVSGNTWFSSERGYSDDYAFTGQRTLGTASVNAPRARAEAAQLFEKLKASRR
ncbi:hypothetical protein ASF71_20755 [Deinococcus sp. Leaf326]|nr:hypothetical protein ASF71_20755 [Deinococcus sp. Leaf326]